MKKAFQDVMDFHKKFRPHLISDSPQIPDPETASFRLRLVTEEYGELSQGVISNDIEEIADAMADLIYVIIGMSVTFGIDLVPIWDEVHAKNMEKRINESRPDGKVTKPPGWTPPDIKGILERQKSIKDTYNA